MRWSRPLLLSIMVFSVLFTGPSLKADDDDRRVPQAVTVTFGGGLNTALPGNALNHHVLPRVIKVRTVLAKPNREAVPGVVNFIVGGFHQIFVYNPHITLQEIQAFAAPIPPQPTGALFINYKVNLTDLFYAGVNPSRFVGGVFVPGANDNIPPVSPVRAGDENRVEQVGFTVPGLYLVICNVTPHLKDGMYAYVRVVSGRDHDDDDDDDHDHDDHDHD